MRTATQAWEAAVGSFGIAPTRRIRPHQLRWLWYAAGVQAGWPWDTARDIRERHATLSQRMATAAQRQPKGARRRM